MASIPLSTTMNSSITHLHPSASTLLENSVSPRIFVVFSGEHPSLPLAELKAILEAEQLPVNNLKTLHRTLSFQTVHQTPSIIAARSSYVQQCCLELYQTPLEHDVILSKVSEIPMQRYLKAGETFAVRLHKLAPTSLSSSRLEAEIGEELLKRMPGTRVNLTEPTIIFQGVLIPPTFLFGIRILHIARNRFEARKPINRPIQHPSTMPPKLARCLVNLARVTANCGILDPFCGTGALLIEAGLIGCHVIGCDIDNTMIHGCRRNLDHYLLSPRDLLVADAQSIAFTLIDAVVTDPPYGRAASRHGMPIKSLVLNTLTNIKSFLSPHGYVVFVVPHGIRWQQHVSQLGYSIVDTHLIREHKSLTREILIFKRG
jgi:tRNA (guanine10-N2)-dimethyltransferase